jgi:hypothetical protein
MDRSIHTGDENCFSIQFIALQLEVEESTKMGEVLTLTSLHGTVLTDKLIDAWFDANEMVVVKKIFSADRHCVEVILIDEDSTVDERKEGEELSCSHLLCFEGGRNDGRSVERMLCKLHLDPSISTVRFIVATSGR